MVPTDILSNPDFRCDEIIQNSIFEFHWETKKKHLEVKRGEFGLQNEEYEEEEIATFQLEDFDEEDMIKFGIVKLFIVMTQRLRMVFGEPQYDIYNDSCYIELEQCEEKFYEVRRLKGGQDDLLKKCDYQCQIDEDLD